MIMSRDIAISFNPYPAITPVIPFPVARDADVAISPDITEWSPVEIV